MAVLTALVFASCGGDDSNNQASGDTSGGGEPVTLTLWTEWSQEPYKPWSEEILKRFEAEHPNITIEHRAIENEQFFTVLRTGMSSGKPPDLIQTEANDNLFQFVRSDQIEDVSDWYRADPANADRFLPGTVEAVTYDGKQYGVPLDVATGSQIYYNRRVLEENGIDPATLTTWDDMVDAFAKLKAAGVTPAALGNKPGWPGEHWTVPLMIRSAGAEKVNQLLARNCGYKWTDPDIVEGAQLFADMVENGYFSEGVASDDYPQGQALFFAGKTGFYQTGSWLPGIAAATAPPGFELGVLKFPEVPGGSGTLDENLVSVVGSISVSKKAAADPAKREAALEFMNWMTERRQQEFTQRTVGAIRSTKGATNADTADPLTLQMLQEQVETSTGTVPYAALVLPKTVGEDKLWTGSTAVAARQIDAQTWMERVEAEAAKQDPVYKLEPKCSNS
ncbi:MAG TPA: extracellular solute-binding protein [Conexibacter sp.]|nr:extracellular solute-binding protein [Conexibacter sp.]